MSERICTASFDGLVDVVQHKDQAAFLVKVGKQLLIQPNLDCGDTCYIPPPREQIPWLLPRGEEVLRYYQGDEDAALYDALVNYHKGISELPSEDYYNLLAAWDMHTYWLEAVQYSPMIWLFAVPERGKTRTGKGLLYVAYRGVHVVSLRDPYLLRIARDFTATAFFDVRDIWRKAEQAGSDDILLLRYEKGAMVPRVIHPERGPFKDTTYFPIFGATVIGTNVPVHPILETRCLVVTMPASARSFDNAVTPEAALPLKERLLAFRARHLGTPLPDMSKPAKGRLGDITKPLMQIAHVVHPERAKKLSDLIQVLAQGRWEEKVDTIEGQLLLAIRQAVTQLTNGKVSVEQVAEVFNADRPENSRLSNRSIGWKLKALGFQKGTTDEGNAAIYWDEKRWEILAVEYGFHKTPESSGTPENQDADPEVRRVQEVFPEAERVDAPF